MAAGKCRSCGADVIWTPARDTGGLVPIDPQTEIVPAPKLVAYNPATGSCRVLKQGDLKQAALWASQGITFHQSHFATCPQAAKWRRPIERP